jgi:hypothetical protein
LILAERLSVGAVGATGATICTVLVAERPCESLTVIVAEPVVCGAVYKPPALIEPIPELTVKI